MSSCEGSKCLGVELHWELASLVVGHPADAQSSVQLQERSGQSSQVVVVAVRYEIDIAGRARRAVRPSAKPTDEDVLDTVAVERFKSSCWLELGFRHQPRRWLADD